MELIVLPSRCVRVGRLNKTFTVKWDKLRKRYITANDGGQLLGVSTDYEIAVGSAVRDANNASKAGCKVTVKGRPKGGKYQVEYVAFALV